MAALLSFCSAIPQNTEKHFPFTLTLQVIPQHESNQARDQPCHSKHYSRPKQHLAQYSMFCWFVSPNTPFVQLHRVTITGLYCMLQFLRFETVTQKEKETLLLQFRLQDTQVQIRRCNPTLKLLDPISYYPGCTVI